MKRLFGKLLSLHILVLIIGYIFIVFGVNLILENYFLEEKKEMLFEQAKSFQEIYYSAFQTGVLNLDKLQYDMTTLKKFTGAEVWLIRKDGKVFSDNVEIDTEFIENILNVENINIVFGGEALAKNIEYTSSNNKKDEILIVGYPIVYDGNVEYGLFLNVSIPEIKNNVLHISRITLGGLILAGTIGILMLSIYTGRINKEIDDLNKAVKYISMGNFEKKINIAKKNELTDLASSFNSMADELYKMEITKSKFVSDLTHDLRSPLTSISGYTKGILDGTITRENQDRYLKIVYDESIRLSKMINDVLDLSKIESGSINLNKTDFNVNTLIIEILDRFERPIIEKNLKLVIDLFKEKTLAHGDYESIGRVIYNLLDNAIKFIDIEGTLTINTKIKDDKILVGIQNSSPFIPEDKLKLIWDRFYKIDKSRGVNKTSTGLGLAIIKEIVKAHDEKIEVYSNEQIGVLFVFSLQTQIFKF